MVAYARYNNGLLQVGSAIHSFPAAGHTFNAAIHTDAPNQTTDDELADLTQITGTGYAVADIQNDYTESGGTATATAVDKVWTAGAADWTATARYVSTYNDTSTGDKLWNYWDYGSTFAVGNGETFTLDFGATWFTLTSTT